MKRLEGRVAIVTGGAQGLGEALSQRLAREGAHVAIGDIDEDGAQQVAKRIGEQCKVKTLALKCDVTCEAEVAALVDETEEQVGPLDILVANAAILTAGEITEFDVDTWRKVVDVNLWGYMICAKHAARVMIPRQRGVIIQINSKSGKKGSFKNSAYAASKFGGIGLTQSLALELAPHNIRVNAICPGNLLDSPMWVNSLYDQYAKRWGISKEEVRQKYVDQVPMGRGCTYEDVANLLVFLCSDESAYMTGQAVNVTGGQEMR
ncbi:MAG: sorbitol-6-phosphate dehydrogenase [Armatimonadota bacterium]